MNNKGSHMDLIISKIQRLSQKNLHRSSPNLSMLKTNYHYSQLQNRLVSSVCVNSPTQNSVVNALKEKLGKRIRQYNTCEDASSFQDLKNIKVLESGLASECANCRELTFATFLNLLERMEQREQPFKIVLFTELKKTFLLLANKIQSDIDALTQHILNLNSELDSKTTEILKLKTQLQHRTKSDDFQHILNTMRMKKIDRSKILQVQKSQDNVETCKVKHEINEAFEEDQLKFSSQEDSFPLVDPTTLNQPMYKSSLPLNLKPIKNKAPKGYQDEFMAYLNEFSESWRQQALVEKRF